MDRESTTPLLDSLTGPAQVGNLTDGQLQQLADELRRRIIEVVARNGGHLAPSLGVVELTLALLATFDMSRDKLVWDVGHQSYAYKLLTGRHAAFDTLRKLGGISGFPRREESPYDHFGVGHSSTSISAAL
ncbi:1-deoxy-D-xylulose-5-phosphate synthase N-terminal domain-containing protein, partial [uncultured Desulfovibrio sp.]